MTAEDESSVAVISDSSALPPVLVSRHITASNQSLDAGTYADVRVPLHLMLLVLLTQAALFFCYVWSLWSLERAAPTGREPFFLWLSIPVAGLCHVRYAAGGARSMRVAWAALRQHWLDPIWTSYSLVSGRKDADEEVAMSEDSDGSSGGDLAELIGLLRVAKLEKFYDQLAPWYSHDWHERCASDRIAFLAYLKNDVGLKHPLALRSLADALDQSAQRRITPWSRDEIGRRSHASTTSTTTTRTLMSCRARFMRWARRTGLRCGLLLRCSCAMLGHVVAVRFVVATLPFLLSEGRSGSPLGYVTDALAVFAIFELDRYAHARIVERSTEGRCGQADEGGTIRDDSRESTRRRIGPDGCNGTRESLHVGTSTYPPPHHSRRSHRKHYRHPSTPPRSPKRAMPTLEPIVEPEMGEEDSPETVRPPPPSPVQSVQNAPRVEKEGSPAAVPPAQAPLATGSPRSDALAILAPTRGPALILPPSITDHVSPSAAPRAASMASDEIASQSSSPTSEPPGTSDQNRPMQIPAQHRRSRVLGLLLSPRATASVSPAMPVAEAPHEDSMLTALAAPAEAELKDASLHGLSAKLDVTETDALEMDASDVTDAPTAAAPIAAAASTLEAPVAEEDYTAGYATATGPSVDSPATKAEPVVLQPPTRLAPILERPGVRGGQRMPSIAGCTASSMMQAGIFAGKTTAPVADSALNFAPIPTPSAAPADPIVERDEREVDSETDPRNDDACSDDDDDDEQASSSSDKTTAASRIWALAASEAGYESD